MYKFFTSLTTSFYLIMALVLCFFSGVVVSKLDIIDNAFRSLNDMPFYEWGATFNEHPFIGTWFLVLIVLGVLLFLNTLMCTYRQLTLRAEQKTLTGHSRVFIFSIHCLVLGVIGFHGSDIVFAHHSPSMELAAGQSETVGKWELTLNSLTYVNDPASITEGSRPKLTHLSTEEFSRFENLADVTLRRDGEIVAEGKLGILSPLWISGGLVLFKNIHLEPGAPVTDITACFVVITNYLIIPFFGLYLVFWVLLLGRLVLTRYKHSELFNRGMATTKGLSHETH